jgi:predicted DNA-binding protein
MADRTAPRRYSGDQTANHQLRACEEDGMKTIAIRLEDEVCDLLGLVSQLEGTTQIEQIREAIAVHLERKVAGGDLTTRAQEALDEVEREADAKRKAIEQLVGNVADAVRTTKPKPTRGRPKSEGQEAPLNSEPEARAFPIGFAPPRR